MSAITEWLSVVFGMIGASTPLVLYKLNGNEKLPLIEAKAERGIISEPKDAVKITLFFSNQIPEKLRITDICVKSPRGAEIMPITYKIGNDGREQSSLSKERLKKYSFPLEIAKPGAVTPLGPGLCSIKFYVGPIPAELRSLTISLRISSSARTLKRRRLAIPINITDEKANEAP
ncbi:hypothetical protein FKW50_08060 [Acetobacter pomorum]|uniref:hypothetical protein n=1 Tax=Acetobacter pomorum TaxID=65959 RepID=UPI00127FA3E4|nr:hypothetical protein [Acetobacter pomorum]KAA8419616.1 hypothetical protein FKW54_14640 [Acetobacter pomorum]KAA8435131.1 hypothetical protein FKW50_08060 [Acetobacter pomorum]KAA8448836.1 hypothetical protein FKW52_12925 [Acetobacter pomorum]